MDGLYAILRGSMENDSLRDLTALGESKVRKVPAPQYNVVREIMRLIVLGEKHPAIATLVGLSPSRVMEITRSPIFRQHQKELQDRLDVIYTSTVGDSFKRRAGEAADTIYNTMQRSECEKLKVTCAQDILDRAGYKAPEKFVVEQRPVLAQADLDAIADVAKELKESPKVEQEENA